MRLVFAQDAPGSDPEVREAARVQWLEDTYAEADRERVATLRSHIIESVGVLSRETHPDNAETIDTELFAGVDDETLVNLLCNAFAMPVQATH